MTDDDIQVEVVKRKDKSMKDIKRKEGSHISPNSRKIMKMKLDDDFRHAITSLNLTNQEIINKSQYCKFFP
jgi:hypothetical protein